MSDTKQAGFATRAIHAGYDPHSHQGSLVPPVYMTSTFAFPDARTGGSGLPAMTTQSTLLALRPARSRQARAARELTAEGATARSGSAAHEWTWLPSSSTAPPRGPRRCQRP